MFSRRQTGRLHPGHLLPGTPFGPTRHIQALDGIRGIAILAVLILHFGPFFPHGAFEHIVSAGIEFGWCGVDLFFCLSGFLITGILLRTAGRPDYFRLFYARRFLRIFPAYYVFVGIAVLAVYAAHPFGYYRTLNTKGKLWAWLYLSNWHGSVLPFTTHLWSLAVEEQFYLVWPLAIIAFRRRLLPFCLCVAVLSFVARAVAVYAFGWGREPVYEMTPFRLDGLALGGAAACIAFSPRLLPMVKRYLPWVFGTGLAIAIGIAVVYGSSALVHPMNTFGLAALAISFSALVLHVATTSGAIAKAFLLRPLGHLGKYSYGIYIFHYIFARPTKSIGLSRAALWIAVASTASYVIARVSWKFVESPFLRLKRRFEYIPS
jgi:peptidoglycan/LPS O-acetylase OafA/YrhL